MMLSTLTALAESFDLDFYYGEMPAFNQAVDNAETDKTIMYHEGYVAGSSTADQQGAWEPSYNMRIWLLTESGGLNDKPFERVPRFESLESLMYTILSKLARRYTIRGNVPFEEGVNIKMTDKHLDGIRFVVNCVAKETPSVIC